MKRPFGERRRREEEEDGVKVLPPIFPMNRNTFFVHFLFTLMRVTRFICNSTLESIVRGKWDPVTRKFEYRIRGESGRDTASETYSLVKERKRERRGSKLIFTLFSCLSSELFFSFILLYFQSLFMHSKCVSLFFLFYFRIRIYIYISFFPLFSSTQSMYVYTFSWLEYISSGLQFFSHSKWNKPVCVTLFSRLCLILHMKRKREKEKGGKARIKK